MINFAILSDIHILNWLSSLDITLKEYLECTNLINKKGNYDYLIIPGDITEDILLFKDFLDIINDSYKATFLTLGNHDLYLLKKDIKNGINNSIKKIEKIKEIVSKYNNIYLLDGEIIKIENITISGITNWYNINYKNIAIWEQFMLDAKYIKLPYSIFELKEKERKKLEKLENKNIDIFISHIMMDTHPTLEEGLPLKYLNNRTNDFFYSEENLFNKYNIKVKYHIFGHTHDSYSFTRNNIKYICNPLGYPLENSKKCSNKILMLKI